jgi:hypothetical protein
VGVLVEAMVCFTVVGSAALLGLFLVPFWLGLVLSYDPTLVAPQDEGSRYYPLLTIAQVVLGVIGLAGVTRVGYLVVKGTADRRWRIATLLAMAAGIISVTSFVTLIGWLNVFEEPYLLLTHLVLPIGGALHLMYLARRALF